jgi:lipoprotein-anchoring transpeptidase ErfK/SrfK
MKPKSTQTRRRFLAGAASLSGLAVAGCSSTGSLVQTGLEPGIEMPSERYVRMYGPNPAEQFPVPAVDLRQIDPKFYRQQVDYPSAEKVGTIVVDTSEFFLYLIQENGTALRYGVGLGRAGFEWSGRAYVGWKRAWPTWTPPESMIEREPELAKWSAVNGGMPPGLENPLGARALYIFQGNVDTLYRIHGSPEFWTIGHAVSSGCVRMMQQDVIDLYARVPVASPIVVSTEYLA